MWSLLMSWCHISKNEGSRMDILHRLCCRSVVSPSYVVVIHELMPYFEEWRRFVRIFGLENVAEVLFSHLMWSLLINWCHILKNEGSLMDIWPRLCCKSAVSTSYVVVIHELMSYFKEWRLSYGYLAQNVLQKCCSLILCGHYWYSDAIFWRMEAVLWSFVT